MVDVLNLLLAGFTISSTSIAILISIFTFLVTFGTLIYKNASLNAKIINNEKLIVELRQENKNQYDRINLYSAEINRLKDRMQYISNNQDRTIVDLEKVKEEYHQISISLSDIRGDLKNVLRLININNGGRNTESL